MVFSFSWFVDTDHGCKGYLPGVLDHAESLEIPLISTHDFIHSVQNLKVEGSGAGSPASKGQLSRKRLLRKPPHIAAALEMFVLVSPSFSPPWNVLPSMMCSKNFGNSKRPRVIRGLSWPLLSSSRRSEKEQHCCASLLQPP